MFRGNDIDRFGSSDGTDLLTDWTGPGDEGTLSLPLGVSVRDPNLVPPTLMREPLPTWDPGTNIHLPVGYPNSSESS